MRPLAGTLPGPGDQSGCITPAASSVPIHHQASKYSASHPPIILHYALDVVTRPCDISRKVPGFGRGGHHSPPTTHTAAPATLEIGNPRPTFPPLDSTREKPKIILPHLFRPEFPTSHLVSWPPPPRSLRIELSNCRIVAITASNRHWCFLRRLTYTLLHPITAERCTVALYHPQLASAGRR